MKQEPRRAKTQQPKAQSVTQDGEADGFRPSASFKARILQGGFTRLEVSSPSEKLAIVHRELVKQISFPCKLRYLQLTDRRSGIQLENPRSFVAVDISRDRLMQALEDYQELFYFDGRHQLWILGADNEQIVLDELGMIYVYPDDFLFRDVLLKLGWPESSQEAMSERDYVQVYFQAPADIQEDSLLESFGLVEWTG